MMGRMWCAVLGLCLGLTFTTQAAQTSDYQPRFLKNEWYSEGWDQVVYFPDGTLVAAQVTVTNVGFGSKHAAVFGALVTPDGETHILKNSRSKGDWEFSEDQLGLEVAGHSFRGKHPNYYFKMDKANGRLDMQLSAYAEPWQLGQVLENQGEFHYASFFAPKVNAVGRYKLADPDQLDSTPWRVLENGKGFAIRYVFSAATDELVRSTMRVVAVNDAPITPVFYFVTDAAGVQRNYVALIRNGKIIRQIDSFELDKEFAVEANDPKRRQNPESYTLKIQTEEFGLTGSVRMRRFLNRIDPVDSLKTFVRTLVKLLNVPLQFRYLSEYDLSYRELDKDYVLKGTAVADYMVMRRVKVSTQRRR